VNLFERAMENNLEKTAPLARRMRPLSLSEFEEQRGVVGPGSLLRRSIDDAFGSTEDPFKGSEWE